MEAEISPSQDSTQEESSEIMDKNDSRAHNTSEVRLVPECDEDDDVIIPLPDDENRSQRCSFIPSCNFEAMKRLN